MVEDVSSIGKLDGSVANFALLGLLYNRRKLEDQKKGEYFRTLLVPTSHALRTFTKGEGPTYLGLEANAYCPRWVRHQGLICTSEESLSLGFLGFRVYDLGC